MPNRPPSSLVSAAAGTFAAARKIAENITTRTIISPSVLPSPLVARFTASAPISLIGELG
jgi:hypothetical protein